MRDKVPRFPFSRPCSCLSFSRRRRTLASPALWRLPTVIGRAVLEEKRILAVGASRVRRVGLAEDLPRPQGVRANLIHQLVIALIGLGKSGEPAEVIVSNDHHIYSRDGRNVISICDSGWGLDHDHNQHVVIYCLLI